MSIRYAILGYLELALAQWLRPEEADRRIRRLSIGRNYYLHHMLLTSGNNSQIYTTLVELHREGLVTRETQPQEHYPARKVYTITEAGLADLRSWLAATPELPQLRNTFLTQLAWADCLGPNELDDLLAMALKFATQAPGRITKLVLLAPGGIAAPRPSFMVRAIPLSFMGQRGGSQDHQPHRLRQSANRTGGRNLHG